MYSVSGRSNQKVQVVLKLSRCPFVSAPSRPLLAFQIDSVCHNHCISTTGTVSLLSSATRTFGVWRKYTTISGWQENPFSYLHRSTKQLFNYNRYGVEVSQNITRMNKLEFNIFFALIELLLRSMKMCCSKSYHFYKYDYNM